MFGFAGATGTTGTEAIGPFFGWGGGTIALTTGLMTNSSIVPPDAGASIVIGS